MKKFLAAFTACVATLGFAGTASAQGDPTISVDPASVDAAGSADIAVTLSNFPAGDTVFVLPCTVPASGDAADIGDDSCDTAQLTTVVIGDDGSGSASVTYDIPDGGLVVAASNADASARDQLIVTVGAADTGAAEAPAADDEQTLPDTGSEVTIAVIGLVTVLAGGALMGASRRRHGLGHIVS